MGKMNIEQNAQKFIDWAAKISTTNLRIFVTLGVVIWTAGTYFNSPTWIPSQSWLAFLLVMCGLDITQYGIKRFSFKPGSSTDNSTTVPTDDDDGGSTASTDVQEISQTVTKG